MTPIATLVPVVSRAAESRRELKLLGELALFDMRQRKQGLDLPTLSEKAEGVEWQLCLFVFFGWQLEMTIVTRLVIKRGNLCAAVKRL